MIIRRFIDEPEPIRPGVKYVTPLGLVARCTGANDSYVSLQYETDKEALVLSSLFAERVLRRFDE